MKKISSVLTLIALVSGCATAPKKSIELSCDNAQSQLFGQSNQAAIERIKQTKFSYRIRREEDQVYLGTHDYRLDRINLEIDNGQVTNAQCG